MFRERKRSWSTCAQAAHAFRFLYHVTLGRAPTAFCVPAPRQPQKLPDILSREEVWRLLAHPPPHVWLFGNRQGTRPIDITVAQKLYTMAKLHAGAGAPRFERVLAGGVYALTVFKVHCARLTLKIYDKGARVLRIEVIVHSVKELRGGKRLEKLAIMLARLQRMVIDFLNVHAHLGALDPATLDTLPQPTQCGAQPLAGIDLQKPRMRAVLEAVLNL